MNEQEKRTIEATAIMNFCDLHVGAFDSGFVEGNTLTIYDLYRSGQNYVKDTFAVNVESLAEKWGNDTAVECRKSDEKTKEALDNFLELKALISRLGINADCDQEDDINNLFSAVENSLKQ